MKKLSTEQKAECYDKAIDIIRKCETDKYGCVIGIKPSDIFSELKESESERVKRILHSISSKMSFHLRDIFTEEEFQCFDAWTNAWLEKQGERYLENFNETEKEKSDFVGDGFIKCHADFLDFKEGETYWLEYIGDDKYNVRSDNLLGKTYHITPCQLYTIFKKQTWLEKQGDHYIQIDDKVTCNKNDSKPIDFYQVVRDLMNGIARGETYSPESIADELLTIAKKSIKQSEQNPANKAESKFHEGDWITNGDYTWKIVMVKSLDYILQSQGGNIVEDTISHVDEQFHSFTIQDAKDGDVLVSFTKYPFIYNGNFDEAFVGAYCGLTVNNNFEECINDYRWAYNKNIKPATKEQCDFLMKAMADAKYTFDFEKKELKKVKQEKTMYNKLTDFVSSLKHIMEEAIECGDTHNLEADADMLLRLAQKSAEWSEEDEKMVKDIIAAIDTLHYHGMVNWLKSLKGRIQPQPKQEWNKEEQQIIKDAASFILSCVNTAETKEEEERLEELADKLQDLRPQNK